jgi:hypothetical protein
MRILRGLGGRTLPCGCLTGVYETYDGSVVRILDERGENCRNPAHQTGHPVSEPSDPPAEHPKRQ